MARFRSKVCLGNKIEWRKSLLKNCTGKDVFLVSQQMLLETTSSREQTKISKDFVLCWMEQTKMMNRLIFADLPTLLPCIM